ncbi:MAG: NupC/NupG family nucleoside CNT transporter [Peptostreptococcaceae bacterium]|jgi:CNT family concentrative nucleoside transporter|nr:NupC/NupG family nucleoside CNT transporter [Peptostreptococcaceae bacterium]
MEKLISFAGLLVLIGIAYLLSENKKAIKWRLVMVGTLMQMIFGIIILKWSAGQAAFRWLSDKITIVLGYTKYGSEFLFGGLMDVNNVGFVFALQILPTIIFFSGLMALLYYLGIMEKIVAVLAKVMLKLLGTSGAESLSAAANIFVGQTEAPLIIKPYLKDMTRSELLTVMVGGMASVSGGVLAGYISLGVDAGHLISASIMSAPASLLIAKIMVPETGTPKTMGRVDVVMENIDTNAVDAISRGTSEGLGLAMNVAAMLLSFTALMALLNGIVSGMGSVVGMDYLSLEWILGRLFAPIAFLMGIPSGDIVNAGTLLAQKTLINEFFAYTTLSSFVSEGMLSARAQTILTYALCGFANIASIGVLVGGIGGLVPEKRAEVATLGVKALIGGTIAAFMTATVAGILI